MRAGIRRGFGFMVVAVVVIVTFGSCSARKNTAPSRFYHALTSRYNTYFNGKTNFDEALQAMNEGYRESYTEQIHLFPINGMFEEEKTTTGGPFDRSIEKANKAIKLHSIKDKPPRKAGWQNDPKQVKLQATEEFNPFTKYCWLLIAESHFYNGDFLTAAVTYSYITRHFATDPELVAEARIRQARCYTQMNWFYETNNLLKKLSESGIPPKQQSNYDRMYAEYLIRSEQAEKSIPYLQNAIKAEKNKRQRARMRYLLGQLYMSSGQHELAYQTFGKVASSNPPYEIEFASRIRRTEVFSGDNYEKVLKELRRMSKNDKNKDFLDQVYYAMGNVYMTQADTAKAIESYAQGIEKSTQNGFDKAICQIRLGDIYFTQKDYINAQPCFSGALAGLKKDYKDYDRISRLSETLDELVVHYEAVHLQDSLQELARMPEAERLAVIDKIIAQIIEDEKKAEEDAKKEEYLASQAARGSDFGQRNRMNMPMMPVGTSDNSFYFYNPQVVAQGKIQFQNKWGRRTLEDHWRRRNKRVFLLQDDTAENAGLAATGEISNEAITQSDSPQTAQDDPAQEIKTRAYYLQQIPFTEEEIEESNAIIEDGLFNMGMIYKDRLEDLNLTVETFEDLDRRFPENTYRIIYYYQVYLMALRYKDTALAERYKNLLSAVFPESDITIAISDPDYEMNMRLMDIIPDSIYEVTYERYLAGDTVAVRRNYLEISSKYPLSELIPKYMFLNALTYVQAGDAEGFKEALTALTEKYPTADVTELANDMLRHLLRGRQLMQNSFSSMTWDFRFGMGEDGDMSRIDSTLIFSTEQEQPHRMILIYSTGSIDRNQLLYAIALYNFTNFRVKGFDISSEEIGTLTIMKISGFNNLTETLDYYRLIYGENGYAPAFDDVVTFFPFSDSNYDVLMRGKTLEEYMQFFVDNFSEAPPLLINRWRVRVDTDKKAAEDENKTRIAAAQDEVITEPEQQEKQVITTEKEDILTIIDRRIEELEAQKEVEQISEEEEFLEEEEEHPAAKRENIFKKLFRLIKNTDQFKKIEEGIQYAKELTAEDEQPVDSVKVEKPLERMEGELTFEQIQEIRKREAEEKAIQDTETALSKEEAKKAADELKKQQAKERDQLRNAKEKAAKERLKQQAKDRKQKAKERKALERAKEKERKAAQKAKEKSATQKKKS